MQLKEVPIGTSNELKSKAMDYLVMSHGLRHENINPLIGKGLCLIPLHFLGWLIVCGLRCGAMNFNSKLKKPNMGTISTHIIKNFKPRVT